MSTRALQGKRVAILVADGFEQIELTEPKAALDAAGAETQIISPATHQVQGWNHFDKGDRFQVDVSLDQARADAYDALLWLTAFATIEMDVLAGRRTPATA